MDYMIAYFVIGTFVSMMLSEFNKAEIEGEINEEFTNMDRFVYIIIWPYMLLLIIYYFTKKSES